MQTYSSAGLFTISGGVALGNPTFLPAFAGPGSAPNLYGTADFGDPTLLNTITFTFPSAANVVGVSGVLFNGQNLGELHAVILLSFEPCPRPVPARGDPGCLESFCLFQFQLHAGRSDRQDDNHDS